MQTANSGIGQRLLFKPEQAAEITGLSRTVIFGLMRSGELRSLKIGRSRRITRAALEEWIAAREREAGQVV